MSTLAPALPARSRALPVAVVLARAEARRILRHPLLVVGALAGIVLVVLMTWTEAPVLNRHDMLVAEALLPLAAGVLIAAHFATMRAKRHRATDLYDASPTSDLTVTVGHLLAVVLVAGAALLFAAALLAYLVAIGGVGAPRPVALASGPVSVLLAGWLGTALGRWAPWFGASPLALIGLVAVSALILGNTYEHPYRAWLAPFTISDAWGSGVTEFAPRPYAEHLVYVLGLAGVCAGLALVFHRRIAFAPLVAAALAVASVTGYAQVQPPSDVELARIRARLFDPESMRTCEVVAGVRYCTYEGYEPWADEWRAVVPPILAAVPAEHRPDLAIAQLPADHELYDSSYRSIGGRAFVRYRRNRPIDEINPTLHWARNSKLGGAQLAVALEVAAHAVGMAPRFEVTERDIAGLRRPRRFGLWMGKTVHQCIAAGRGRYIVALYLAASATDETRRAFDDALQALPYAIGPNQAGDSLFAEVNWELGAAAWDYLGGSTVSWANREPHYAAQLLERDRAAVRALLHEHWEELNALDTTTDEAAALLGLSPLPSLNEMMERSGRRPVTNFAKHFGAPQCR